MKERDVESGKLSPQVRLEQDLSSVASNLWGMMRKAVDEGGLSAITCKYRENYADWFMVVKRENPDNGKPEVIFVDGSGFVDCLLRANKAIAAGRWREDKPWAGARKGDSAQ